MNNINKDFLDNYTDINSSKRVESVNIFNTKNYLDTKLNAGETERKIRIRILPIDSDGNPFKIIHTHNVQLPKVMWKKPNMPEYKNFICINKTEGIDRDEYGTKCPICERNFEAFKKSQEFPEKSQERITFQKISLSYLAKESCIIRCIERGKEEDGPKFWKFNIRHDKTDPMNQIISLYKDRNQESIESGDGEFNILDLYNGKDLILTITPSKNEKIKSSEIKVTDESKTKPISTDKELIQKWLTDTKKWNDVFTVKPYEYLSLIINDKEPYKDKETGKWIEKKDKNQGSNDSKPKEIIVEDINTKINVIEKEIFSDDDADESAPF